MRSRMNCELRDNFQWFYQRNLLKIERLDVKQQFTGIVAMVGNLIRKNQIKSASEGGNDSKCQESENFDEKYRVFVERR